MLRSFAQGANPGGFRLAPWTYTQMISLAFPSAEFPTDYFAVGGCGTALNVMRCGPWRGRAMSLSRERPGGMCRLRAQRSGLLGRLSSQARWRCLFPSPIAPNPPPLFLTSCSGQPQCGRERAELPRHRPERRGAQLPPAHPAEAAGDGAAQGGHAASGEGHEEG